MQMAEWGLPATHLILDHDSKFTDSFDVVFKADGCEAKRVGPMAPNMNPFAERFAQTLRHELLDHFIIFGEKKNTLRNNNHADARENVTSQNSKCSDF